MSKALAHTNRPLHRRSQRGVAAIEFALIFVLLFSMLYALATFGSVLYIKQAVTRASEEGARAVGLLTPAPMNGDIRVKDVVYDALANSLIVPASDNANLASRRNWIVSKVNVDVTRSVPASPGAYVRYDVTVSYPYSANRLLPTVPFLDFSQLMTNPLRSRTSAALRSS